MGIPHLWDMCIRGGGDGREGGDGGLGDVRRNLRYVTFRCETLFFCETPFVATTPFLCWESAPLYGFNQMGARERANRLLQVITTNGVREWNIMFWCVCVLGIGHTAWCQPRGCKRARQSIASNYHHKQRKEMEHHVLV